MKLNFYKFRKSNVFKTLIIFLAIYMCVASVISFVMASDIEHMANCTDEYCSQCMIMHLCQIQLKSIALLIPPSVIALIIFIKHKFINSLNRFRKKLNLIDYKIQLNI